MSTVVSIYLSGRVVVQVAAVARFTVDLAPLARRLVAFAFGLTSQRVPQVRC